MKNKKLVTLVISLFLISSQSFAMGSRRPRPAPNPTPKPDPTRPEPAPPWSDTTAELDPYEFQSSGDLIGDHVDQFYGSYKALNKDRGPASVQVDSCQPNLDESLNFSNRISFYVQEMLGTTPPRLEGIASIYKLPSSSSSYKAVGLMTHNLCRVTSSSLSKTIKKGTDLITIERANAFATKHNNLRTKALTGDYVAKTELVSHWTKFFSCLAYKESLTTADTSKSYSVANKYGPSGYSKPKGVKFYEDPYQNEASKLNIGLFQFTPTASGNINPCLKAWSQMYPSCPINSRASRDTLVPIVGSSLQSFNAFCGVHKLVQTFTVQSHTSNSKYTHPDNKSGSLRSADKRCVTPHFYSGWAYNHFGPLMNSTGSNLKTLMECVSK